MGYSIEFNKKIDEEKDLALYKETVVEELIMHILLVVHRYCKQVFDCLA